MKTTLLTILGLAVLGLMLAIPQSAQAVTCPGGTAEIHVLFEGDTPSGGNGAGTFHGITDEIVLSSKGSCDNLSYFSVGDAFSPMPSIIEGEVVNIFFPTNGCYDLTKIIFEDFTYLISCYNVRTHHVAKICAHEYATSC